MTKTFAYATALFLVVAAGCGESETRTIASASNPEGDVLEDVSDAADRATTPMILSSIDGSVQEEVVYTETALAFESDAQVFEVPEIIATALSEAPGVESEGDGHGHRQLILKNEDGSIQEEVVFVDSDDELGSNEDVEVAPAREVIIAALQVPSSI